MKRFNILLFLLFLSSSFASVFSQELVINHLNVITMLDDKVLEDHSIYVKDGVIMEISPEEEISAIGVRTLDGRGMYVFPGLAEFHGHLPNPEQYGPAFQEEVMMLYLANGVLRIRSMLGHDSHLALRDRVMKGELLGPRTFVSGPSLNGTSVTDPEAGRAMVKAQKAAGYDHLKLHPGLDTLKFLA
nr:amidohydrolase [Algoriphagus sp.]